MPRTTGRAPRRLAPTIAALGASLLGGLLVAPAAQAAPDSSAPVIAELYVNGGSTNAPYRNKFVELHNPTDAAIDLSGWSLQYRSATGTGDFTANIALSGTIPAGGDFLVQGGSNAGNGELLTNVDLEAPELNMAAGGGVVALVEGTSLLTGAVTGDVVTDPDWAAAGGVDLVGYGTANTFETARTTGPSATTDPKSIVRTDAADTDVNSADLTLTETVTPCGSTGCAGSGEPEEPVDPTAATIAEIQGTGTASPLVGQTVVTEGVVTAAFPTGGLDGIYLQTAGTGGAQDPGAAASHGIFVYSKALAEDVTIGQTIKVTGVVSEYYGLTEITPVAQGWEVLEGTGTVEPTTVDFPMDEPQRETLEGMLVQLEGDWTVTNNYTTHQYGEIGLAAGTEPLVQPTEVVRPGTPEYTTRVAENAARAVTLDDGSSANYTGGAKDVPTPWLTVDNEVRTGASVEITAPLVLDYRFATWRVQPTSQLTAESPKPAEFGTTREATPDEVGGALQLASFNVLNYFPTTGAIFEANGGSCTYYTDRAGEPVTTNRCTPDGPRGAADDEDLQRQQAKIVAAINDLGADVVALEEIENSAAFGLDRDAAVNTLVAALNAAELAAGGGEQTWSAAASPATVPTTGEDVIRNAFIYRTDAAETAGEAVILDDPAFVNARAPLAQAFRPLGGGEESTFLAIANHFKSKGSGSGADADTGDGQGASNASRVNQATALVGFADELETALGTNQTFLMGDFNSYTQEDPLQVLIEAGYVNIGDQLDTSATYVFSGQVGSLDHVFASSEAFEQVTGADVWDINADESIGREYSRYNNNATLLYDESVFRSSDHDPMIVGYDPLGAETPDEQPPAVTVTGPTTVEVGDTAAYEVSVADASEITAVEYSVNAGEWVSVEDGTFTLTAMGAGEYVIEVRGTDASDNVGMTTVTLTVVAEEPEPEIVFSDIAQNTFRAQIEWLVAQGITTGYANPDGSYSYRGSEAVLREQMAAFLFRFDQMD